MTRRCKRCGDYMVEMLFTSVCDTCERRRPVQSRAQSVDGGDADDAGALDGASFSWTFIRSAEDVGTQPLSNARIAMNGIRRGYGEDSALLIGNGYALHPAEQTRESALRMWRAWSRLMEQRIEELWK